MSEPLTHSELAAAIGPIRGKVDLLDQRVGAVEQAQKDHVTDAERDKAELREVREWIIRADAHSAANRETLERLLVWQRLLGVTGLGLVGFVGWVLMAVK